MNSEIEDLQDQINALSDIVEDLKGRVEMLTAALCSTTIHPDQMKLFP